MSVQIQKTPNPNALKYILPEKRFEKPLNISDVEAAAAHPLARKLFDLGNIYNVFMVQDFVTVNKLPDVPWEPLDQQVKAVIADHFGL